MVRLINTNRVYGGVISKYRIGSKEYKEEEARKLAEFNRKNNEAKQRNSVRTQAESQQARNYNLQKRKDEENRLKQLDFDAINSIHWNDMKANDLNKILKINNLEAKIKYLQKFANSQSKDYNELVQLAEEARKVKEGEEDVVILQRLDLGKLKAVDLKLIDMIHNNKVRSRLQHEWNLQTTGFYKNVRSDIDREKNRQMTNGLFNSLITTITDNIPVVGSYITEAYNAFSPELAKKDELPFVKAYTNLLEQYPELQDGSFQKDAQLSEITGEGLVKSKVKGGWHCHKCNKVVKNWKSHENSKLHGAGLFDWIKNKATNFFSKRLEFNNTSKATLNKLGNLKIIGVTLAKKPIHKMLDKLLNLISLGKWNNAKGEDFDKLYHTGMIFNLENNTKVLNEKVEEVMITTNLSNIQGSDTTYLALSQPPAMTLNELFNKAIQTYGNKKFFDYSGLGGNGKERNNCQDYIKMCCETLGIWNESAQNFIYQDLTKLQQEVPEYTKKIADTVTGLGNWWSKITGSGLELHSVRINKSIPLEEAKTMAQEFIKNKNKKKMKELKNWYNFRVKPKSHFTKKFVTKKINKNVMLVLGEPVK